MRAAAERPKPNEERLREFTDGAVPRIEQMLRADIPIYPKLEELTLSFGLTRMREFLGPDYPLIHQLFAQNSPDTLAARAIGKTRLASPVIRMQLWYGGAAAVDASRDPMIELARASILRRAHCAVAYEDEVEAPVRMAAEQIARARPAASTAAHSPGCQFHAAPEHGQRAGMARGRGGPHALHAAAGLFARASGYEPFELPRRWLDARAKLNLDTPLNLSTSNDIVGGDSGSPVLDAKANIVGVVFDGNIHSIAGAYWYSPVDNRAVAVDAAALREALRVVYGAQALLDELGAPPG